MNMNISPPVKACTVARLCKCSSNSNLMNCCNLQNPVTNSTPTTTRSKTITTKRAPATHRSPILQFPAINPEAPTSCPPKIHSKPIKSPRTKHRKNNHHLTTTSTATAIDVLRLMDSLQFPIPTETYASLLKECTDLKDVEGGAEVHAHMINRTRTSTSTSTRTAPPQRQSPPILLTNRLLLMYASCGRLEDARNLFDKMSSKDSNSWLIMIAAHSDQNDPEEALHLFNQMQQPQVLVKKVNKRERYYHYYYIFTPGLMMTIIPSVLKACINTDDFGLGKQVHGWLLKHGHGEDLLLCSLFIDFYGRCRCLESARRVFDQVLCHRPHHRDTVIWTAMMAAYCREGHYEEVIYLFNKMGRADAKRNNFTISTVLRACGRIRSDDSYDNGLCGRQVHANAIKLGLVESNLFVQSSLVDMYGKCGLLKDARMVFEMIGGSERNEVCWNAMLNSYTQHGWYKEALKLLYSMKTAGFQPPESMLNTLTLACGGGGDGGS